MRNFNNIILIGYRGTGKSVVAKELEAKTGRRSISIDQKIENEFGSINNIVKNSGWDKFRQIETEMIMSIDLENGIVDCGGGIIEKSENIKMLKSKGTIFWLKASLSVIEKRLIDKTNRPALTAKGDFLQEIADILKKRKPLYKSAADFEIDTDEKTPKEIAAEIVTLVE